LELQTVTIVSFSNGSTAKDYHLVGDERVSNRKA